MRERLAQLQAIISEPGRPSHLAKLFLLLLLMTIAFHGGFNAIIDFMIRGHIDEINRSYIQASLAHSNSLLEILSAIKVSLSLLQSSSGGISFFIDVQIQLGETLNVVAELANHAWQFSVASVAAGHTLQILLDLSRLATAPILTLFFALLGLGMGIQSRLPRLTRSLNKLAATTLFVVLFVHLIVPLSVYGTAASSHYFFNDYRSSIKQELGKVHKNMPKHDGSSGLHGQVEGAINQFEKHQQSVKQQTANFSSLSIRHMVVVTVENLLLPLLLLYTLSMLFLSLLRQFFVSPEQMNRIQAQINRYDREILDE